jgi:hypothetical protein
MAIHDLTQPRLNEVLALAVPHRSEVMLRVERHRGLSKILGERSGAVTGVHKAAAREQPLMAVLDRREDDDQRRPCDP